MTTVLVPVRAIPSPAAAAQVRAAIKAGDIPTLTGFAPPQPTAENPSGSRTIFGLPVIDVAGAAAVLGGLGFLLRKKLGL